MDPPHWRRGVGSALLERGAGAGRWRPLHRDGAVDLQGQRARNRLLRALGWRRDGASRFTRAPGRPPCGSAAPGPDRGLAMAPPPARHNVAAMTVTFAEKLSRIPHYEPGTSLDDAKAQAETADAVKLASNESPFAPHPDVIEAIHKAAADVNRYPDPDARALRRAIADAPRDRPGPDRGLQRLLRDPARRRPRALRGRATRSSTPGPRSRSIRTCRRSRAPARSGCRSPTATCTTSTRCSRR